MYFRIGFRFYVNDSKKLYTIKSYGWCSLNKTKRDPFFRTLGYVRPYIFYIVSAFICIVLYSIFSALVLTLPIPLLETLVGGGNTFSSVSKTISTSPIDTQSLNQLFTDWIKGIVMIPGDQGASLLRLCFFILIVFFGRGITGYLQQFFFGYMEQNLTRDIRNDLFTHLHKLSLGFFSNQKTGHLISRFTNDAASINLGIKDGLMSLLRDPLMVIAYLSLCFIISWQLTLFSLLILPVAAGLIAGMGLIIHKQSRKSQETMAGITSVVQETIQGVKVVKAFGMEEAENSKFKKETDRFFGIRIKIMKIDAIGAPLNEFLGSVVAVFIIFYGGHLVLEGKMDPGSFLTFVFAILQISPPLKNLGQVNNKIQESRAAASRIFEIMDIDPEIKNHADAKPIQDFTDEIKFESLSFSYKESEVILDNVNFTANKGEIIAFVGPSGAGKSTLIDLIPRFYDPIQGRILIDGQDIKSLIVSDVRKLMGIVTQETILFNDSIKTNISYGMPNATMDEIISAAKSANAHDFILGLPNGYETIVGDRGVKISGGQRQRISIARALLKNPPIMILDEATSALDTESEKLVQQAIELLMKNRTSFVVAHRLSTIRNAHKIVVLEKGKIVQIGSHDDLLKDPTGVYKKLYDMQFRQNEE